MKRFHGKYLIVVEIFIFLIVIASQDISVEKKKNPAGKSNEASVRTQSVKNSHIVFSSWTLG